MFYTIDSKPNCISCKYIHPTRETPLFLWIINQLGNLVALLTHGTIERCWCCNPAPLLPTLFLLSANLLILILSSFMFANRESSVWGHCLCPPPPPFACFCSIFSLCCCCCGCIVFADLTTTYNVFMDMTKCFHHNAHITHKICISDQFPSTIASVMFITHDRSWSLITN